jgi:hypothetical protein
MRVPIRRGDFIKEAVEFPTWRLCICPLSGRIARIVQAGNKLDGDWRSSLREETRGKIEWLESNTRTRVSVRGDTFGQWLVLVEDGAVVRRIRVSDDQWEGAASEAVEWVASRAGGM